MARTEGLTNAGKKESRQYNQILDKAVKEGKYGQTGQVKEVDARTTPHLQSPKMRRVR